MTVRPVVFDNISKLADWYKHTIEVDLANESWACKIDLIQEIIDEITERCKINRCEQIFIGRVLDYTYKKSQGSRKTLTPCHDLLMTSVEIYEMKKRLGIK
jgi:hypothetical protein